MKNIFDICIIGGGVLGLSCAWRLAQAGRKVDLIERDRCGSGASSAALGALWASTAVRSNLHHMHHHSLRQMQTFCNDIFDVTGFDCGYKRCGRFELVANPNRTEQIQDELTLSREIQSLWNVESVMEFVSPESLKASEPFIAHNDESILQCHITAMLEPIQFIEGLKQACLHNGVAIHENTIVEDVVIDNYAVQSVNTPSQTYQAEQVLITAGAWIRFINETLHQQAPVKPVRGQGLIYKTKQKLISHIVKKDSIYLIPKDDHHIMVGSTTEMNSGFDENVTDEGIQFLRDGAIELLPALKNSDVVKTWAGLRPMGMDKRPFLGKSPEISNLYFAAGFFKTGLGMSPIASQLICDVMCDKKIGYDIRALQPGRIPVKRK